MADRSGDEPREGLELPGAVSADPVVGDAALDGAPDLGSSSRPILELDPAAPHGPAAPAPRRSGLGGLLLGGMIAAALGFGAAWLARDRLIPPPDLGAVTDRIAALEARPEAPESPDLAPRLDEAEARLAAVEAALAEAPDPRLDEALSRLAALEDRASLGPAVDPAPLGSLAGPAVDAPDPALLARLAAVEEVVAALGTRVGAAEARSEEAASAAAQAADGLTAARTEAEAEATAAAEAALGAQRRAALLDAAAALDAGEPVPLDALASAGLEPPAALAAVAAEGAPTLAALRDEFPAAAREALSAARASGAADEGGFGAFLRGQLGVRSTSPRPGDDPDAVLSRAEAALRAGRLDDALAEAAALPEPARAALAPWTARAQARADALAALASLDAAD